MKKIKHKIATGLIRRYMNFFKFQGLATPWNTIYYIDKNVAQRKGLIAHELTHIEQMGTTLLSKTIFLIRYNIQWVLVGYKLNPFEIEARKAQGEADGISNRR